MKQKNILSFFLAALLIIAGCTKQNPTAPQVSEFSEVETQSTVSQITADQELSSFCWFPGPVTAMTRNIYIGGDVDLVMGATDPTQIPFLVAKIFKQVDSTNFPERAMSLAREIAWTQPHVVGLQEVSLIRYQSPGDAVVGGTSPATDTLYNYLGILMRALRANGAHYKVAGVVQDTDIELPMVVSQDPLAFDDVRLTDFDVILVRHDVRVSDVVAQNYQATLVIPGSGIAVLRGFVAVKAKIGRQAYRVVNTHLEPASVPEILPIQRAQAQELLTFLQDETLPVIITGDFNSDAPDGETYKDILLQGYTDIWTENWLKHNPDGYTSGHDYDLLNPVANFTKRIDFIFVRYKQQFFPKPVIGPVFAIVVGDEDFNRTPSGLWPSDHGGVVARFRMATFSLFTGLAE
jgi:hypothetical protein